jgi:hypothetical protein
MLFHKTYSVVHVKQAPTSADLARINQFALEPVTEEQLFVGTMALCNDQVDRSHERFPDTYLQRFAATLPGKSVMPGHDYRQLPLGRFYDAEVTKRDGRTDLVASYYLLADDPLVGKIKAGIAKDVSIGFEPDQRLCDLCGKNYDAWMTDDDDEEPCRHIAGREYEGKTCTLTYGGDVKNVEAVEGSFVWMGCQPGAEAIAKDDALSSRKKAAWLHDEPARKEKPVQTKSADKAAPDKEAGLDAAEKARVARLVAAGEKYYAHLQGRIETRWSAMQAESTGKSIAARLTEAPIDELEAAATEAEKLFEEKFAPPTASKAEPETPIETPSAGFNPLRRRRREML